MECQYDKCRDSSESIQSSKVVLGIPCQSTSVNDIDGYGSIVSASYDHSSSYDFKTLLAVLPTEAQA